MKLQYHYIIIFLFSLFFFGCSSSNNAKKNLNINNEIKDSAPLHKMSFDHLQPVVPKFEPKSRIGNPKNYEVFGKTYSVLPSSENFTQTGIASWYGTKFHGRKTSNGDTYDMYALTAAHKSLPLPSYVEVTNLENGKTLVVRVNDRGPFHDGRIIDLSYAAASKLGVLSKGTARVSIKALNLYDKNNIEYEPMYASNEKFFNKQNQFIQAGAFGSIENALRFKNVLKDIFNAEKIDPKIINVKNINNLYKIHIDNAHDSYKKITKLLSLNDINYSLLTK